MFTQRVGPHERTLVARKVISKTVVTDDFDGDEIQDGLAIEVKISIADIEYRLDLRPENVERFRADVRKWIAAAEAGAGETEAEEDVSVTRRTTASRAAHRQRGAKATGRRKGPAPRRPREEIQAVREWAARHGFEVSERGRISNEVHDAFQAAH
ncbi:Lsr2 dimerization domain-containing protein [Nocardia sp. CA-135953]|uniref:Lsr2 dimerization domain-containing protein n=1 Tax=Nocardia sp. CA-135953 TaxID=3239978 RepID=UPI003D9932A2